MIGFGAELDQLDEIGSGPGAAQILADAGERVLQRDFGERMQIRFPAARDLDFRFEKQIQFPSEGTLRAPGAFRRRLNAA